jgi:hypothetical protein
VYLAVQSPSSNSDISELPGGAGYNTLTGTITRKTLTVSGGTVETKTYDGTDAATVSVLIFDGVENGETLVFDTDYEVTDAAFADGNVGENKTVTINAVLKSTAKTANYELNNGAGYTALTGTINQAPTTADLLEYDLPSVVTYDGTEQGVTVTGKSNVIGLGETITVKYDGDATAPTNAGIYAITVDISAGSNYAAATGLSLGNFTIGKRSVAAEDLQYDLTGVTYDGSAQSISVAAKETVIGLGETITVKYDGDATAPTNAGIYAITVDISAGGNYEAANGLSLGNFTIGKRSVAAEDLQYDLTGVTYDGSAQSISVAAKETVIGLGETITVKYDGDATAPTNAGTYAITVDISAGGNYEAANNLGLGDFTIGKKTITVSGGTIAEKTYDGNATANVTSVMFSGTANSEPLAIDTDYEVTAAVFADVNAGTGKTVTITVVLKSTDKANNYDLTNGVAYALTGQTIGKCPQSILFTLPDTLTVESGSYSLSATVVASGAAPELPALFRTSNAALAEISGGELLFKHSGTVVITAYVAPDPNYEAAAEVSRELILTSNTTAADREASGVIDDGDPNNYVVDDPETNTVTITIELQDSNSTVIYNGEELPGDSPSFTVDVTRGGTQEISYTVVSPDGTQTQTYTFTIEKRLDFAAYTRSKWNVLYILHLRKLQNEDYDPSLCRWYRDGQVAATGFFYNKGAGNSASDSFLAGETYYFELETPEGLVRSTEYVVPATTSASGAFRAYPNPVRAGHPLYISSDRNDDAASGRSTEEVLLETGVSENDRSQILQQVGDTSVRVYTLEGALVRQQPLTGNCTEIRLPTAGLYIVRTSGFAAKIVVE